MTGSSTEQHWSNSEKKKWLMLMFWGTTMVYSARLAFPVCSVAISKEMGWDKTQSGAVLSAFFWGYAMTQCLGGYLSDRIGGEVVMMTAALFWTFITAATPFILHVSSQTAASVYIPIISRVMFGSGQGVHFPSLSNVLGVRLPTEERGFGSALSHSGNKVGAMLTGSMGSVLILYAGWSSIFYFLGALSLAWILAIKYVMLPSISNKTQTTKSSVSTESEPIPWGLILKNKSFWALLFGHFCNATAFFVLLSWIPTYFEETFPKAQRWVYNVVPWCVGIPTCMLGGKVTDMLLQKGYKVAIVRKGVQTVEFLGFASCLLLVSHLSSFEASVFCMACGLAFETLHSSGICINPQDIAPKHAGFVFGLMNTCGAIPGFLGTYAAGYILETTGSWATVFNLAAFILILGWLTFTIFGTTKRIV